MLYIPATNTVILSQNQRYIHPTTNEVYGGTDYGNADKLAEIGAVPLTIEPVAEGYRATDWTAVEESGAWFYRPTVEADPAARDALLAAVNVEREQRKEDLTVTADGMVFDADEKSRSNIMGVVSAISAGIPITFPIDWRDSANVTQSLTQVQLVTIAAAMMAAVSKLYSKSWTLKDTTIPGLTDSEVGTFNVAADEHWSLYV